MVLLAAAASLLIVVDWTRVDAWNGIRQELTATSFIDPQQTVFDAVNGNVDARLEWDEYIFEITAAPSDLEVHQESSALRLESKSGIILISPADTSQDITNGVKWCIDGDVPDYDGLMARSREHWMRNACDGNLVALASLSDLLTVYYCYTVTPKSLTSALLMDDCHWQAYSIAITRKTQLEGGLDRGAEFLFTADKVGVLRLGNKFMGTAVDVLVYSCDGQLQYSYIAEADSLDSSRQLALNWLRSLNRVK